MSTKTNQYAYVHENIQLFIEKKIQEIPDDTLKISRRLTSRVEDLIERRKKNRGLTPTQISYKKRSQS
ncbi:unnamed protein product [Rotaria sordida]|uniref:Uncharacterized protein n=1 Tax=Rotaria sordida TaxID=392033 RepID=A0A814Q042_9BILA|nr:unnamed protein product [Rotaria sordida]